MNVANDGWIALVMGKPTVTYLRDSPELGHSTTDIGRVDVADENQVSTMSCCTESKRVIKLTPTPQTWPVSADTTLYTFGL